MILILSQFARRTLLCIAQTRLEVTLMDCFESARELHCVGKMLLCGAHSGRINRRQKCVRR